jgi:2-C-methyl-D-erythritol 2,4-cyclodiphosphate synthase
VTTPSDRNLPNRQSVRLPGFDYTRGGAYFITICTTDRRCIFGDIAESHFHPSALGQIVQDCWDEIPSHHPQVELDTFQVMPNHVHGVLWIIGPDLVGATPASPAPHRPTGPSAGFAGATPASPASGGPTGPASGSLSAIIGSFKSAVSRRINQAFGAEGSSVWQRSFFEHVVRDEPSLQSIRKYIVTNPERWPEDKENPLGNGRDDVEVWVRSLVGATPASPARAVAATPVSSAGGPEMTGRRVPSAPRATQASPLPEPRATQASPLPFRIGHGYDIHRLRAGGTLRLGGVVVDSTRSAVAHSDGDVVLHAVVDAILGGLALGDIGEHFPNDDPRWKGAGSRVFLEHAVEQVRAARMHVVNLDVTVLCERPKLRPFKNDMVKNLADWTSAQAVNVKAGTNEGCDAVGRGEAIAAHAVVLLAAQPEMRKT